MKNKALEIDQLFQAYLEQRLPSAATITGYRKLLPLFVRDTNVTRVHEVTISIVLAWRDLVLERASAITWNTYLRQMRALFSFGKANQFLEDNPFRSVSSVPPAQNRKKTISQSTLERALALLTSPSATLSPGWFWAIVVRTIYTTGIRRTQLVALRWSDVDLKKQRIRLSAEGSKTKREWVIPITPPVAEDLKLLRDQTALAAGSDYLRAGQVFNVTLFNSRYKGQLLTTEQVTGFFRRLSNSLGPDTYISSHRLRHTMATELAPTGDIATLQTILGHSDVRSTLSYAEPDLGHMAHLMNRLPQP